jgi:hypothetical protein
LGLLSQVLPGLRDLRTPLAVGALWTLAGAFGIPLLPTAVLRELEGIGRDIEQAFSSVPTVALGSFAALGVYLLGVAMSLVGSKVTRLMGVAITPPIIGVAVFATMAYFLWRAALLLVVVASLVVLSWNWASWHLEGRSGSFADHLARNLRFAADEIPSALRDAFEVLVAMWNPTREQVRYFLQQDLERQVDASPDLLRELIDHLSDYGLVHALRTSYVPIEQANKALRKHGAADRRQARFENWNDVNSRLAGVGYDLRRDLRDTLYDHLEDDPHAKSRFFTQVHSDVDRTAGCVATA